ncbi:hypothetical protein [Virgibacillus dokdonensis]
MIHFKHEVEDLLGVKVDVVTENSLHWSIKKDVLAKAVKL